MKQYIKKKNESTTIKKSNILGMLNRVKTDGKYRIQDHNIMDLILHTAYLDINNKTIE
jgi:hypothetical protein